MHEYVQKSTSTTLPRRLAAVSGGELSHCTAPSSDGSVPSTGSAAAACVVSTARIIAPPAIAPPLAWVRSAAVAIIAPPFVLPAALPVAAIAAGAPGAPFERPPSRSTSFVSARPS